MRIVTLIPVFRESFELIAECLNNVSSYTDGAVVCVNDFYNKEVENFIRSFPVVKKLAFVNKDYFSDAIINTSLLTMAQELQPDWIVKQDVDEEFEPRFSNIRKVLSTTNLDWLSVLWPSYVQDRSHHCFYHHDLETGASKPIIFRFDLSKLYVPARPLHTNLAMFTEKAGVIDIRLFHSNLLKSDQENYTKFVLSGRERTGDKGVTSLRRLVPDALEVGKTSNVPTYTKRKKDAERLLRYSFISEDVDNDLEILSVEKQHFDRGMLIHYLSRLYEKQDVATRLASELPEVKGSQLIRRALSSMADRFYLFKRLREEYRRLFTYR
jgi:hypothetical protein